MKTISVISAANARRFMSGSPDLAAELQKIYDSEINVRISWLWNCGIDLWLGDDLNGYVAAETVSAASEIAPWLQEAIAHFYPASNYAASLSTEVRARAAIRPFLAPRLAARVNCPHCGAPNVVTGMEELIAFVCSHCGNSVEVESPKVQ
jgi:hypothetical protein